MAKDTKPDIEAGGRSESQTLSKSGHSSHGMDSSVLKFKNVNFTVGKGDKKKYLLTDVNGTVKWGRVLASTYILVVSICIQCTPKRHLLTVLVFSLSFRFYLARSHGTLWYVSFLCWIPTLA